MSVTGLVREFKRFDVARLFKVLALGALLALLVPFAASAAGPTVSPQKLESEIAKRLSRVEEFKFIEREAEKMGVRVYLFGGTAAAYAHYVKWDIQRESGDRRFQADRFDYDFTNIYRSTQDLDIVVDGTETQARELAALLLKTFPNFQGNKDQWEVRLLRQSIGDKEAILGNPDFLNQHTDSNSTGLIELTSRPHESRVKDVRDWDSVRPQFLVDVAEGKIHYYFSDLHETTSRFRQGKNPPIVSVIRFLTKAFQYELEIRPEDEAVIRRIIQAFDPKLGVSSYVGSWLDKNGPKLFRHAVNIEYAWNESERLGLRQKLITVKTTHIQENSVSYWLSKEPMRSRPVGEGSGKTARELGIKIVAHETNSFLSYESITRAHTGEPNVLISRRTAAGEQAAHGDGFYTAKGRKGMRSTGWTIRFEVDPNAREKTDFDVKGDIVIFHNKKALKIIPESVKTTLVGFLNLVDGIDSSERGVLEKVRRRISNRSNVLSADELKQARSMIASRNLDQQTNKFDPVLKEWFDLPMAVENLDLVESLLKRGYFVGQIIDQFISMHDGPGMLPLIELAAEKADARAAQFFLDEILTKPTWEKHPRRNEWIRKLVQSFHVDTVRLFIGIADPSRDADLLELVLHETKDHLAILHVLFRSDWQTQPLFGTATAFMLRNGLEPAELGEMLKFDLGPVATMTLANNIADYMQERSLSPVASKIYFELYRKLASSGTPKLSTDSLGRILREKARSVLVAAETVKGAQDSIEILASFGHPPLAEIIATFEKQTRFDTFLSYAQLFERTGYFEYKSVAQSFLKVYLAMSLQERLDFISRGGKSTNAVALAAESLGPSHRWAKSAVNDLRAAEPMSKAMWISRERLSKFPLESREESKLRAEFIERSSNGDSLLGVIRAQRNNPKSAAFLELTRVENALPYYEAFLRIPADGGTLNMEKRAALAASLLYSPLVFDPEKRALLVAAAQKTTKHTAHTGFAQFVSRQERDYESFLSRSLFGPGAEGIRTLAAAPDLDTTLFGRAIENLRKRDPHDVTTKLGPPVIEGLASLEKFDRPKHEVLKTQVARANSIWDQVGILAKYILRADVLKNDPEFANKVLSLHEVYGGTPDELLNSFVEEARRLSDNGSLTRTQIQLIEKVQKDFKEKLDSIGPILPKAERAIESTPRGTQMPRVRSRSPKCESLFG